MLWSILFTAALAGAAALPSAAHEADVELPEEGETFFAYGATRKWFRLGHGAMQALSLDGITPGEYNIYAHGNAKSNMTYKSTRELARAGVRVLHHPADWSSNVTRGGKWSETDIVFRPSKVDQTDIDTCTIAETCVGVAASCGLHFYAVALKAIAKIPAAESWLALTKNPLITAVAGAAVAGSGTYWFLTKASGDTDAGTCAGSQGDLAEALTNVAETCTDYARSKDICLAMCETYLTLPDPAPRDTIWMDVHQGGTACPATPACGGECYSG